MTEESTTTPTLADRIDMAVWNALKKDDVLKHDRYISVRRDVHWAIVDVLEAIEAERAKRDRAMADELDELSKHVERECYWCEDCQLEVARGANQYSTDLHADHEVVRITVIEGWLATEIDSALNKHGQSEGKT